MPRIRVLLIDDNLEFLDVATTLLEGHDFEIVAKAENGEDGLKAALSLQPDVIVLDISMPRMNGFEVARRLRHHKQRAGIVLLTFHEDVDYVRAGRAVGAIGYVIKRQMATDLPSAVRCVHAGRTFISAPLHLPEDDDVHP
jgi:DNA-binding NarL/FixJ family response regulator